MMKTHFLVDFLGELLNVLNQFNQLGISKSSYFFFSLHESLRGLWPEQGSRGAKR